jgi:O-antigen/teichoic acid export membrane protein
VYVKRLARLFWAPQEPSAFRRNFYRIARANLIAIALPLLFTPVLTRLFSPDAYGALATFMSIYSVVLAFCTWRFDWTLPNARTSSMAATLFAAGTGVLAIVCVATAAMSVLVVGRVVFEGSSIARVGWPLLLLPVALCGGGLRLMLTGWFVRDGDLTAVGRATISQSAATSLLNLAAGLGHLESAGLIGSMSVSVWVGLGALAHRAWDRLRAGLGRVTWRRLRAGVRLHGRTASWSALTAMLNALGFSAPILVLGHYYSSREVGWYALMYRVLAAPTGVLTSALSQSFWSVAAQYGREGRFAELKRLYRLTTLRLSIACVPVVIICWVAPSVTGLILGDAWSGAGEVLRAMLPFFIGSIVFSPTNHLVVLDAQSFQIVADATRLILVVASIALGSAAGASFVTVVFLASLSSLIAHAALFVTHARIHTHHERS